MFEKFTENAIKSIMHSREEARRLEFGYVQIEHLLLGILHDRLGTSSLILSKLGVDLKKARRIVERLIGRGYSNTPLEQVSFNMDVMEIISNSVSLANSFDRETVSAEHILLTLIKSNNENLSKIFYELNLDPYDIEMEIKLFWKEDELIPVEELNHNLPDNYSPKFLNSISREIINDAKQETIRQKHCFVGTEQLLLSLSKLKHKCLAQKMLSKFGLDENLIRVEISRMIGYGSGTNNEILTNTSIMEKSLEYAWIEAKRFKYGKIGSGHLLVGITTMDNTCTSSHILKQLNLDPEQIRWETLHILKKNPNNPEPDLTIEQIETVLLSENGLGVNIKEEEEIDTEVDSIDNYSSYDEEI